MRAEMEKEQRRKREAELVEKQLSKVTTRTQCVFLLCSACCFAQYLEKERQNQMQRLRLFSYRDVTERASLLVSLQFV